MQILDGGKLMKMKKNDKWTEKKVPGQTEKGEVPTKTEKGEGLMAKG